MHIFVLNISGDDKKKVSLFFSVVKTLSAELKLGAERSAEKQ